MLGQSERGQLTAKPIRVQCCSTDKVLEASLDSFVFSLFFIMNERRETLVSQEISDELVSHSPRILLPGVLESGEVVCPATKSDAWTLWRRDKLDRGRYRVRSRCDFTCFPLYLILLPGLVARPRGLIAKIMEAL